MLFHLISFVLNCYAFFKIVIIIWPGRPVNVINLFSSSQIWKQLSFRLFQCKPFKLSLLFVSKACAKKSDAPLSYPLSGRLPGLLTNIRPQSRSLKGANAITYFAPLKRQRKKNYNIPTRSSHRSHWICHCDKIPVVNIIIFCCKWHNGITNYSVSCYQTCFVMPCPKPKHFR